jgi:hypothetical protein
MISIYGTFLMLLPGYRVSHLSRKERGDDGAPAFVLVADAAWFERLRIFRCYTCRWCWWLKAFAVRAYECDGRECGYGPLSGYSDGE